MKKSLWVPLILVSCAFVPTKVISSQVSWTKFYNDWTSQDLKDIRSHVPICESHFRFEVERNREDNSKKNLVTIRSYWIHSVANQEKNHIHDLHEQIESLRIPLDKKVGTSLMVHLDGASNTLSFISSLEWDVYIDIVSNMKIDFSQEFNTQKKGLRIFSYHEVINKQKAQGLSVTIWTDRDLLKFIINDYREKYPDLLNSSCGKDIVVFLGKTGCGKSTLINYLGNKELEGDKFGHIILKNPQDPQAMSIGIGSRSETLLPKMMKIDNLLFYDLAGFGDTRENAIALASACFIKHIIENASSVKVIFVAGIDEITSGRGSLIENLTQIMTQFIPESTDEQQNIMNHSALIITKSRSCHSQEDFKEFLMSEVKPGILNPWIETFRLGRFSKPKKKFVYDLDRPEILKIIEDTPSIKIPYVNSEAIYRTANLKYLKQIYQEEMDKIFHNLWDSGLNLLSNNPREKDSQDDTDKTLEQIKNLKEQKNYFMPDHFFKTVNQQLTESEIMILLKPISSKRYQKAWDSKSEPWKNQLEEKQKEIDTDLTQIACQEREAIFKTSLLSSFGTTDLPYNTCAKLNELKKNYDHKDSEILTQVKEAIRESFNTSEILHSLYPINLTILEEKSYSEKKLPKKIKTQAKEIIDKAFSKRINMEIDADEFAQWLNTLQDIKDYLAEVQKPLDERKEWAKAVLNNLCQQAYKRVENWMDQCYSAEPSESNLSFSCAKLPYKITLDRQQTYKEGFYFYLIVDQNDNSQEAVTIEKSDKILFKWTTLTDDGQRQADEDQETIQTLKANRDKLEAELLKLMQAIDDLETRKKNIKNSLDRIEEGGQRFKDGSITAAKGVGSLCLVGFTLTALSSGGKPSAGSITALGGLATLGAMSITAFGVTKASIGSVETTVGRVGLGRNLLESASSLKESFERIQNQLNDKNKEKNQKEEAVKRLEEEITQYQNKSYLKMTITDDLETQRKKIMTCIKQSINPDHLVEALNLQ